MRLGIGSTVLSVALFVSGSGASQAGELRASPASVSALGAPLNEKDLAPYKLKGRASIAGQAFWATDANKVFFQPGGLVVLLPVTRQTRDWFERTFKGDPCATPADLAGLEGKDASNLKPDCQHQAGQAILAIQTLLADRRLTPYIRTTRTNPTGHFWFTKLPAGKYYVISPMRGTGEHPKDQKLFDTAWALVKLDAGERMTNVVVTDQSQE